MIGSCCFEIWQKYHISLLLNHIKGIASRLRSIVNSSTCTDYALSIEVTDRETFDIFVHKLDRFYRELIWIRDAVNTIDSDILIDLTRQKLVEAWPTLNCPHAVVRTSKDIVEMLAI